MDEPEDVAEVVETESCECQACCDPSTPHQPLHVSGSKTTHSHESKERQDHTESYSGMIQQSWYMRFLWITVC